jgi:hypothetical protein
MVAPLSMALYALWALESSQASIERPIALCAIEVLSVGWIVPVVVLLEALDCGHCS